eukprot:GEMP01002219.1.p1 GENE.GEMP01002219.1~~GEMP01002219.1.p1  ORF type:complete len:860 (+),score=99.70 GEMP01002219.1:67-2646(+)
MDNTGGILASLIGASSNNVVRERRHSVQSTNSSNAIVSDLTQEEHHDAPHTPRSEIYTPIHAPDAPEAAMEMSNSFSLSKLIGGTKGVAPSKIPARKENGFLEEVFGDKANKFTLRDSQFCGDSTQLVFEQDIDPNRTTTIQGRIIRFQSTEGKVIALLEITCALCWMFYVPFSVSFRMHYQFIHDWRGIMIEVSMDVLNILFLILRCFTSFCDVKSGKEYCALHSIRKMVMNQWVFLWSILGCVPFISVFIPLVQNMASLRSTPILDALLVFIKTGRCVVLLNTPASFMSLEYNFSYGLARLFVSVLLFAHMIACIWHLSIYYCNDLDRIVALHLPNEEDRSALSWYLIALRDGLFMVAAQDRQFVAKDGEFIVLCIIGPAAAFYFAYVFGNTTVLITRSLALQTQHCSHMAFIRSAMDSLDLPTELQRRIVSYHHYLHVHHNPTAYDALFTGLSVNLLIELKLFLFRQLFMEKASFFRHCHPDLIQKIVIGLKECTYSPGDIIILRGWIGDSMFFIVKGKCDVLNQNNVPVAALQSGDHFGEIALIYEQERNATVRAATYCVLGKLDKSAYDDIMMDYPDEREHMRLVAEERISQMKDRSKDVVPENLKSVLMTKDPVNEALHSSPMGRVRQSILLAAQMAHTFRQQFATGSRPLNDGELLKSVGPPLPESPQSSPIVEPPVPVREPATGNELVNKYRTPSPPLPITRKASSDSMLMEESVSLNSLEWSKSCRAMSTSQIMAPPERHLTPEQRPITVGFIGDVNTAERKINVKISGELMEILENMNAELRRISQRLNSTSSPKLSDKDDGSGCLSSHKLDFYRRQHMDLSESSIKFSAIDAKSKSHSSLGLPIDPFC